MPDLAAWLLEQIDTDERAVRDRDRNWPIHYTGCYYYEHTLERGWYCDCEEAYGDAGAKYLAECAAKRRIVADRIQDHQVTMYGRGVVDEQHRVLRLLAAVYADRPGYDPAWAPSGTIGT